MLFNVGLVLLEVGSKLEPPFRAVVLDLAVRALTQFVAGEKVEGEKNQTRKKWRKIESGEI
jgi:hypothetical protein